MAEVLHAQVSHTWLITRAKICFYDLKLSHNTSVADGQLVHPLLTYDRPKIQKKRKKEMALLLTKCNTVCACEEQILVYTRCFIKRTLFVFS